MNSSEVAKPDEAGNARLNDDLLWLIFMKNTQLDDPSHNRLLTARSSSQVCQQWRTVLLNAPSIWGRLLDLDELGKQPHIWRDLLAKRIADSQLWIRGSVTVGMRAYFSQLLKDRWNTIQLLDISDPEQNAKAELQKMYAPLLRKASSMQVLKLTIAEKAAMMFKQSQFSLEGFLFDDYAPYLEELVIDGISWKLQGDMLWLSNLRVMSFDDQTSTPYLLKLLSDMPLLEHVRIADHCGMFQLDEGEAMQLPFIELPHLLSLWLNSRIFFTLLPFLERLRSSPKCGLHLDQPDPSIRPLAIMSFEEIRLSQNLDTRMVQAIMRYMESYFQNHPPTSLSIYVGVKGTGVTIQDYWSTQACPSFPSVCFSSVFPVCAAKELYNSMEWSSFDWLPNVDRLEFSMIHAERPIYDFPLTSLLSALSAVTTLCVSAESMQFLMKYRTTFKLTFFPNMRTLQITYNRSPHHPTADLNETLPGFMLHCVGSGTPLSVVDLTLFDSKTMPDLDFLDDAQFSHLTIKWRMDFDDEEPIIREDKCDPEVLLGFRSRYVRKTYV
ncbi:hypothetical protein CPC08DRAFT_752720 [Agrocybe pediades]|nr:hypothetical protein CPC08DRAFT_752720 [Agrocybe pediades]